MSILEKARSEFIHVCNDRSLDLSRTVAVHPLSPHDAIGDAEADFVIKKGKEYVIEAAFDKAQGQAFTGIACQWNGTIEELLSLELSDIRNRGIFVASMNAVLRSLGLATGTNHCRDEDPTNCGPEIAGQLEARFGTKRFGLVGLQPAILKALVNHFTREFVRVVDLNPDNIGSLKSGIEVWDGQTDLPRLVEWSEAGLVTGSSIVNGTIDEIISCFKDDNKPLVFFGNTISGTAGLLDLDRLCPFGR
ncbi:MAG: hypothetical protein H8D56_16515 [Planctomycetes bacterium]|nr:hypothetical protein [Planctomycetota bacterium]MBL7144765.1 hypothetical protein [Phycisphaerae bacterium]